MKRILLVEDDADLLDSLALVLQLDGFEVVTASANKAAHAVIDQGGLDLIVADSVLRGGNGDDLAKTAQTLGVPVIVISGDQERIERLQGGPLPFIAKPFRGVVLVELVKSLLARG